ncbi:CHAT domain-containing protein [Psychroserpens sp.]
MKLRILLLFFINCFSCFVIAQDVIIDIETKENKADSLFYSFRSVQYSDKNYVESLKLRNEVLLQYKDTASVAYRTSLAKKYASKAVYLGYKGVYDSAIVYSKKSIHIIERQKNQNLFLKGNVYLHLYEQTAYNGNWNEAYILAKKTRKILQDTLVSDHKLIADVEFDIGYAANAIGDYETGLKQYIIAKDKYISFIGENNYEVANKFVHLAKMYSNIGNYKKEIKSYKNAARILETINYEDKSYLNIVYGSLFTCYLQNGNFDIAEQYLVKSEKLIADKNDEKWFNETFLGRTKIGMWRHYSDLFSAKRDTTNALLYNTKILNFLKNYDLNDKRNNPNNQPFMKNWIIDTKILALRFDASLIKTTNPIKAKEIYEAILFKKKKNEFSISAQPDRLHLANLYLNENAYDKANIILSEGVLKGIETKNDYDLIQFYAKQANLYRQQRNIEKMHFKYQQVFRKMQKDSSQNIALDALKYSDLKPLGDNSIIGILLSASKNYYSAYSNTKSKYYLKIAQQLSLLTSVMYTDNYNILGYSDKTHNTLAKINERMLNAAFLLKDDNNLDEILQKIEESNSKISWKKFLNSNQRKYINIPDSILDMEDHLKSNLLFYKKKLFLSNTHEHEKRKLWKEKILDFQKELNILTDWYQKNYSSYFNQTQKTFDLKQLKSKLKKRQKIVKYIFTENRVFLFAISKNKTELYFIGDKNHLSKTLTPLIKSLTNYNSTNYKKLAKEAYRLLLPSVVDNTHVKELIFILDDVLHYLPLEVLIDSNNSYLVEKHAISYSPSLLLWNEQSQVKKAKKPKIGIFAPTYKKQSSKDPNRNENTTLLGASNEALQIAKLFNSDVFTGDKAIKQEFINKAKAYSILHLAMHSTINNANSEFSNLAFTPTTRDSKLFISELYTMSFNADLAVLSACNTAIGNEKKGEGLVNVSSAFMYAGVPSTVTSLWKVPDKETEQIMVDFYKHLKDGKSKNEALQLTKLNYLTSKKDGSLMHPYYWAGFVVSGDISPIVSTSSYGKYIFGSLLLLFGVYFLNKRKHDKKIK